jgi:hypothetical protein
MAVSERVARVRALAELLEFLPGPSRAEIADKFDGLGLRIQPELALPEEEIRALADALWFVAVPGRRMLAYQLRCRGVTVHPELATLEVQSDGPAAMGKHAPQRVVKKAAPEVKTAMLDILRQANPDLAARMDAAGGVDSLTDEQRRQFGLEALAVFQSTNAEANQRMDAAKPEDFEPGS